MTKRFILPVIIFLLAGLQLTAQDNQLTLRDAITGRLYPFGLSQLGWRANTRTFVYVEGVSQNLMNSEINGEARIIVSPDDLAEATGKPVRRFPQISWIDENSFHFDLGPEKFLYNISSKKANLLYTLPEGAVNQEEASNQNIAFTKNYNIYVSTPGSESPLKITFDGNREIQYGIAAHRSEFGIRKGLFWSPAGNRLAFYRVDQTMVTDYPLVDYTQIPAEYTPNKYPMAGGKSHHATIGIYDLSTRKTVYLKTGTPAEQYLTNITWSPDGKSVYVAVVNRDQNHMWLKVYDAVSGKETATLFEEKNEKYVEPEHGPIFMKNKPEDFLWFSKRDGFNHLYHYRTNGTLVGQITKGNWEVSDFIGFTEDGSKIIYESTEVSPVERHIYCLDLEKGKAAQLTKAKGTHSAELSADGEYFIDNWSSLTVANASAIIDTKKGKIRHEIEELTNPLDEYQKTDISIFPIRASDGTDLYCRMYKPGNFDPAKKYPVIVYVYGGPHVQLITESWNGGGSLFMNYLAQQGYVVFTLDNRGSGHRGLEFEQAVYRRLGTQEIEDQLDGVRYLRQQAFVDTDRIGVHGWSYGGFMTTSLMLRKPGVFKVGVAGGPVIDWRLYEIMYTERYMDTPEQNPEGYKQSSLLNHVDKLQGDLLVIHGMQDSTVVPQHVMMFTRKCVEEGKLIDFFPYPTHEHNVRGLDREHLYRRIEAYFKENL